MMEFLDQPFLGRTLYDFALAAAILVASVLLLETVKRILVRKVEKRQGADVGGVSFVIQLVKRFIIPGLYIGALYAAVRVIEPAEDIFVIIQAVFVVLVTWIVVRFFIVTAGAWFARYISQSEDRDANRLKPLLALINLAIWAIGAIFLLDNLGFEIATIVAGLGIGGIAIALAAQAVLGDLFSYFVIFLDRPFEVGDFLIFGDILGSVEKIGAKTTLLRSLSGEQIIVGNADLTNARVRNYKRMAERRIVFSIGVTYDTPAEKLKAIPEIIRQIVAEDERARFDRSHFKEYGDSSLVFETVYYVLSPDYTLYMDVQQRINFAILDAFEEEGIEFAFPTRTLHLAGGLPSATWAGSTAGSGTTTGAGSTEGADGAGSAAGTEGTSSSSSER